MFASPDYAASLGPIQGKDDFAKARFVGLDRTGQFLGMLQQMGYPISEANLPVHTENFLVMWALVKRGMGIGMIDSVIGDADPGVVRLWEDEPSLGFPIWLVAHRDLHQNRRLRFVWDFLADALR
jgi:DNA-binding transcriptional LysR family regulator